MRELNFDPNPSNIYPEIAQGLIKMFDCEIQIVKTFKDRFK